jgi:hypothetical protein
VKANTHYGRKKTFSGFEISQSVSGDRGKHTLEKDKALGSGLFYE